MIAGAISFNSGILLFADADVSRGVPGTATRIFRRGYGSSLDFAQSIFVVSDPVESMGAPFEPSERALAAIAPADRTIARMRDTYEAARSMDELDLTTVFSIAVDALAAIRSCLDEC